MSRLRTIIFWMHLLTALCVGGIVVIMSTTAVLLTYQRQIQGWADTRGIDASAPFPGAEPLSTGSLVERVASAAGAEPTALTWRSDPDAPVAVGLGGGPTVLVSAYTGELLGQESTGTREFFRTVTDWHRWLARSGGSREWGRAVTGGANLGFLFLVLSGFYLWWPRNWSRNALRKVMLFRPRLRPKARDFNWHHVIGFWSAIPLVIVVSSGVVISYAWATDLVNRLAGDASRAADSGRRAFDQAAATPPLASGDRLASLRSIAEARLPGWASIEMFLPEDEEDPVTFIIDRGTGGEPHKRATLQLDQRTGDVLLWEPFAAGAPGQRVRSLLRFAHTGEAGGVLGQTLAGLVSLGSLVLVWTGFALTWRRFSTWRRRRTRLLRRGM